jgi:predicted adenylyl cyclase CyaB
MRDFFHAMKNIEIKARCHYPDRIRDQLKQLGSSFVGSDHQTDTYFNINNGRLKLRQGNIENALIYYDRPDQEGPKLSTVKLIEVENGSALQHLLDAALGILVRVEKIREIHYIQNVKFHIDEVVGLGNFVEIEAIDRDGTLDEKHLYQQCTHYMQLFDIRESDLMKDSYSDKLITMAREADMGRNA